MWGLIKGKENSNVQAMFVSVRFGVFLDKGVQSVHTFTVAVAIVIENGSIEAKEWNTRNCLTANQKKQKSNNLKHGHICKDFPPFSLLSDLSRYQRTNEWMNWKQLITMLLQRSNHRKSSSTNRTMESHRQYRYRWPINVRKHYRFIPINTYSVSTRCDVPLIRPLRCKVCTCRTNQDEKRKLFDKRSWVEAVLWRYYDRTRLSNTQMNQFLIGTII